MMSSRRRLGQYRLLGLHITNRELQLVTLLASGENWDQLLNGVHEVWGYIA